MQARGVAMNDDKGLEREADVMGERALQVKPEMHEPRPDDPVVAMNDDAGSERVAGELGNRATRVPLERVQYMAQTAAEAQRQGETTEALKDINEPAGTSGKQVHQRMVDQSLVATQRMESGDGVVQMNGYKLSDAGNVKAIGEQEVGTGQTIQFTKFTSCIGVIGKKTDRTLVGIHLVRFGKDGEPFKREDVPTLKAQLSGLSDVTIIGQTDFWEPELLDAIGGKVVGGTDDGSFSATTDEAGEIIVKKES